MEVNLDTVAALEALGLTELEARVYLWLLTDHPATGYRIAREIGKPVANTYKALETLHAKGAIEITEAKKRLYTPSPPQDLLRRMREQYTANINTVEKQLKALKPSVRDTRIYQLSNTAQVIERSRSILAAARRVVVADAFPAILDRLAPDLRKAAARRVDVSVKCYQNVTIKGVTIVRDSRDQSAVDTYPGEWLKVVADAREHLIAFLSHDLKRVYQAAWSRSPFLSILHFNAIRSEMLLDQIGGAVRAGHSANDIKRLLNPYNARAKTRLPGYIELLKVCGDD
jgi:HTH-type transcriptional regulator, sugar sensing transcriptional regulator